MELCGQCTLSYMPRPKSKLARLIWDGGGIYFYKYRVMLFKSILF